MHRIETRDDMMIEWDVPIAMDDGIVLRADVYRPVGEGKWPVIMAYGPYAKGRSFATSRPFAWKHLVGKHPHLLAQTSNKYQAWELVDPEYWVPDGYAILRNIPRCAPTISELMRRTKLSAIATSSKRILESCARGISCSVTLPLVTNG